MRISDLSSDVCSSDLVASSDTPWHNDKCVLLLREALGAAVPERGESKVQVLRSAMFDLIERGFWRPSERIPGEKELSELLSVSLGTVQAALRTLVNRSEEHTSELQSLMRISYAV